MLFISHGKLLNLHSKLIYEYAGKEESKQN
jgi:hypothetical protein